jgi:hypothetical protein
VLDVEGFPIVRSWYVVHAGDRKLSVVAQAFFEYLTTEARQLITLQPVTKPKRATSV